MPVRLCGVYRYKDGKPINQLKIKRMRVHLNHALEIRDVCQEDFGIYTVVLRNSAASLERRLNLTLLINGNWSTETLEWLLTKQLISNVSRSSL